MIQKAILDSIDSNRERYTNELMDLLSIPSISTYSHNAPDIRRAAGWVQEQLKRLNFQTELIETKGHPVVYGEYMLQEGRPTLLIYGHYDVQPPEPLDEWVSPPFSPSIRDGYVYARGATDDKGQLFTYIKAIDAILENSGKLPINVKFLIEGEEEVGSPNLDSFLREHGEKLRADAIAISDGSQFAPGIPAITYGLRGLSYLQIDVEGPRFDLHSGSFGGLITNPVSALAGILARLKNEDGTIAIPGFYDDVSGLEDWERREMASLQTDESKLKEYLGVDRLTGEPGYTIQELKSARPTLDANGIWGGFSGEGAKTIIPARAGAKVSMRLVPNQKSSRVNRLFEDFVRSIAPPGVRIKVTELHGADPVLIARDHGSVRAAERAIEIGFGKHPVFIREGGSIPVVNLFKELLNIDGILLLGWGSPDDGAHSPNEKFLLDDFIKGIRSAAALLYEISE